MEEKIKDSSRPLKPDNLPIKEDEIQISIYLNRLSRFRKYSIILSLIVIIMGVIAFLGWLINIPLLRGEFFGVTGTKLNSSVMFIILGICLYLLNKKLNRQQIIIPRILALIICIWSGLTLFEYATGINLWMDQILTSFIPGNGETFGRTRFLSSVDFFLMSIALLMASYKYKIRWVQLISFTSGFIALIGFSSHLYGFNNYFAVDVFAQMAFMSSILQIFLAVGTLCLCPDRSYMGRVTAQNSGGFMARRLLPTGLGSIFAFGLIISLGDSFHLYSDEFGDIFSIIVTMIFLATIIIWNAKMLNQMDHEKQKTTRERLAVQQFYENLVEGINEGIWVTDKNDQLYFMNKGMESITGVKIEDMASLNILDDLPTKTTGHLKGAYIQAKKTLTPVYYDSISMVNPKGEKSYQSGWIIPQVFEGVFDGAICTVIDQTQRKKAEQALSKSETYYKTIFENTGTATIILSEDSTIKMANKKTETLSGYHVKDVEGKMKWLEFVHPDDLDNVEKYHKMRRNGNGDVPSEYELRMMNKNGEERQIMLFASLFPGTTDSVVSLLDITELKNTENEIKQSLEEKELLLREIHHRVKNNMQIISSLLNLQRNYIKDSQADNLLKESQGRVKSMALVHEKLYQTKDLARINVTEYIQSLTMNLFHSYSVKPGISIQIDVGEVFFDIDTAVPLGLIINELVSNSLKYAFPNQDNGKITITLHENTENRGSGEYILIVEDDGQGFPDKLDFKNTPSLGLQLVNTLVNQLDGTIERVECQGTCLKIVFLEQHYKKRV